MTSKSSQLASFGKIVRQIRESKGFSQEEFAALCGLDRTYISGIERGRRNIGLANILLIADALNVKASTLLEFHAPDGNQS